jgi:predicted nucleic acid-binding protein
MRILVDTNVLLRAIQHDSSFCAPARAALKQLLRDNCALRLAPQNIREFWNVCTRPTDRNGLGISVEGAGRRARVLERYFDILPDSVATYRNWRRLLVEHQVSGAKVHDAWLVAAMRAEGINRILTFSVRDFIR